MDHRLNLRMEVRLPVVVLTQEGAFPGVTSDFSFEGAQVHLDREPSLSKKRIIELRFEPEDGGVSIPAVVVRKNGTELGLMFGHYGRAVDDYLTHRVSEAIDGLLQLGINKGRAGPTGSTHT